MIGRAKLVHSKAGKLGILGFGVASTMLAFFVLPFGAYAADLHTLESVDVGGAHVIDGGTISIDSISNVTNFWTMNFTWPNATSNSNGVLAVFRGTFGNLDGGVLINTSGSQNNALQVQGFAQGANSITKQYAMPMLGSASVTSGTYTVVVAELGTYPQMYGDFVNWFQSGGTLGAAPANYSTLTFTYDATSHPTELPTALHWVGVGGRLINYDDQVLRNELQPLNGSTDSYWTFNFDWPNFVQNQAALLMVFRGTFGNLDGGAPVSGVNYGATVQQWAQGHNEFAKFINLPALKDTSTAPSFYTVMVAERDPKFLAQDIDQQALWFASGGTQGIGPKAYSLLTFDYKKYRECCSSVAFIPGLKGSILKTGSQTLWPPSLSVLDFTNDIQQLAIDPLTSESINTVSVAGVLEDFVVGPFSTSIYSGFTNFLRDLKSDGSIADWRGFPYDWRFSPSRVVGDEGMVAKIESLAADSDTGQVTIVAHSMGGLVGKVLINQLDALGKSGLVDSYLMVGTPQLGTPQALAALLHGDEESILGGVVVNAKDVRAVAQNMPGTYDLLPAAKYFDEVQAPVVSFDSSSSFTSDWIAQWGSQITQYLNLFAFATGGGVTRAKPLPETLRIPEVLDPSLMTNSANLHSEFDNYVFPSNIRVVQVAGWGLPTTKTINYRNSHFLQSYETFVTLEGDSTVLYPSAASSASAESFYFNLFSHNRDPQNIDVRHRSLLNSPYMQNFVRGVIDEDTLSDSDYITLLKPVPESVDELLVVSTHSPVILGAYDSLGNFTGIDQNQDLSAAILKVTEGIPGSTFVVSSDTQSVFLPKSGTYSFVYKGVGDGPTTVVVDDFVSDITTTLATYTDIPTTAQTSATFMIESSAPASATIALDQNGDSVVDQVVTPDTNSLPKTLDELLSAVMTNVQSLNVTPKLKANLLKRADKIVEKIEKQKQKKSQVLANLKTQLDNKTAKGKIDAASSADIIALIDELVAGSTTFPLDIALLADLRAKVTNLLTTQGIRTSLLKKVSQLEKTEAVTRALANLTNLVSWKASHGKIAENDAQILLDLLTQVENTI